jgi:ubiquinone/menaquinone biosynthesis C-methylase UbiE
MLTARQQRERDYHVARAGKMRSLIDEPVPLDILASDPRRPWNAYWSMYDRAFAADIAGKRVLIPGCGYGEDAIRLAILGAEVSAFDLCGQSIDIARERARRAGLSNIDFNIMPAEALSYPDDVFDVVLFVDILHHVDIPPTISEIIRVLKKDGIVIGDELYTHSGFQRLRESMIVDRAVYPLMKRWIYDTDTPYITQDEHKIDQAELKVVLDAMIEPSVEFFGFLEGRLFPTRFIWTSKMDHALMRWLRYAAPRLGSRVVFSGKVKKAPR